MDFHDDLVRLAGREVQPVDVLGHEEVQRLLVFELDERLVRGVRLRGPHLAAQPVLPRAPAHVGIAHVVLEGRGLLGRRVLGPHAVRPAEVGDPRLGRDAGAGERDDAVARRVASPRWLEIAHAQIAQVGRGSLLPRARLMASRWARRDTPARRTARCAPRRP